MKKFDPVACCTHIELDTARWPGSLPAPCGNLIKKAIEDSEHDDDVQKRKPRQSQGWINMKYMRFMHTPITSATCFCPILLFCHGVVYWPVFKSWLYHKRKSPTGICVCVCHYSLFQASRAAGGVEREREREREREKSNAMSHSVLEREREGGRILEYFI